MGEGYFFEAGDVTIPVTMPEGTDIEDVPLETLLEVELDGEKVLSWSE
jgi:hypothetical protein